MDCVGYLIVLLCIVVIGFTVLFFKYPRWVIAGLIIAKPIIDTTFAYYFYSNINLLKIVGFLFVVAGTGYIIRNRLRILQCPVSPLWLLFLALNFISIFFIFDKPFIDKAEYFIRILLGFVTLILFFNLFDFERDKEFVLSIFVISSTLCILIWLNEVFLRIPRTSVAGISDELTRIKGPYLSFSNFLFYSLQLIICALPLLNILHKKRLELDAPGGIEQKDKGNVMIVKNKSIWFSIAYILLTVLIIISTIIVYKSYTKAGWIALPLILFLWFILRRKLIPALLVIAGVILFISINPFRSETGSLFRKEVEIIILRSDRWEPDTLLWADTGDGREEWESSDRFRSSIS